MAGNTRGKLKEHFEGAHRNFDWILYHCEECLKLIGDKNPKLTQSVKGLAEGTKTLDELALGIYSKL